MIGILGGMGTQAGLDFCNKLAMLNRGKIDQEYPLFMLYNKSDIPGRPESIGVQTKRFTDLPRNLKNNLKYIYQFYIYIIYIYLVLFYKNYNLMQDEDI